MSKKKFVRDIQARTGWRYMQALHAVRAFSYEEVSRRVDGLGDQPTEVQLRELLGEMTMQWWWLSFVDKTGFRGACIVTARTLTLAQQMGLAMVGPVDDISSHLIDSRDVGLIDQRWRNRLLTRAECEAFDAEMMGKLGN